MDPLIYMCTRDYDMVLSYINTHVDILTVHLAILSVYTVRMMSFHKNLILNIGCRDQNFVEFLRSNHFVEFGNCVGSVK